MYHLFIINSFKPAYLSVVIFGSKNTQNVLKQPDLNPFTNVAHFSHSGQCGRTCKEFCIKQYYFSNRLSGFTGDQSNHGCLQVGAQGKSFFFCRDIVDLI